MSDPSCRGIRDLLGVYVVGAIDPPDRALVDAHLSHCHDCREELAGLAGLPALLRRVPFAEAEQIAAPGLLAGEIDDPPAELLSSLLRQVAARRRSKRLRGVFAAAAALVVAVSGGAAVSFSLAQSQGQATADRGPAGAKDVVHASSGGYSATVRYGMASWGTTMWVQVSGVEPGIVCKFWVVTKNGARSVAGGWTVGTWNNQHWYVVDSPVSAASVTRFEISSGSKVLLRIPAST
jgi:predicted anti-sigma-YlaC factor YlaD